MKSSFESDRGSEPITFIPEPLLAPGAPAFESTPDASTGTLSLEAQLQAAYDAGHQAGRNELPWREEEELTRTVEAFKVMLDALDRMASHWVRAERDTVLALATAMAKHLVGAAVEDDPNRLAPAIESAMELVAGLEPARVQLAPEDFERIQSSEDPVLLALMETHRGRLVTSDRIAAGSAVVESQDRRVAVSLAASLDRMAEELGELSSLATAESGPEVQE